MYKRQLEQFDGIHGCYLYQGRDAQTDKLQNLKGHMLVVAPHEGLVSSEQWLNLSLIHISVSTWKDTKAYDSQTGMYWVYNYYVKAFKTVNGKRIYSKPTKTVNLYS